MWLRHVTAGNLTLKIICIPIGIRIRISIRCGTSVTKIRRLLLGPLGLGSGTVNLETIKIIGIINGGGG